MRPAARWSPCSQTGQDPARAAGRSDVHRDRNVLPPPGEVCRSAEHGRVAARLFRTAAIVMTLFRRSRFEDFCHRLDCCGLASLARPGLGFMARGPTQGL